MMIKFINGVIANLCLMLDMGGGGPRKKDKQELEAKKPNSGG